MLIWSLLLLPSMRDDSWHDVPGSGTMNRSSPHGIWLGRSRELAEIEVALDELAQGRGRLVLVTGEPGIGKTRLADEAARSAADRGVGVHWGRAWEGGGAPAYWPFIQALRTLSPDAAAVASLVTPSAAAVERFQLFGAVGDLLDRKSVV